MKKSQPLFLGILIIITVPLPGVRQLEKASGMSRAGVLTIYNWEDYISPSLIMKSEKEHGYKVDHETLDSNEAIFTKIQQGGTSYDIATPSEYMIQKIIKEKLVLLLGHLKIKGLNSTDPRSLDLDFDPNNQCSIPYFWGTLGTVYDDKFLDVNQIKHWGDLWRSELEDSLMLIDGTREIMGLSLNSSGYSLDSKNMAQLTEAANKLNHLTPSVKATVADEIKMYMINGKTSVAVTFSGEVTDVTWKSEHLHYVILLGGPNLWFDDIVMPGTVRNKEDVYDFINFILEPENTVQNTEYIGYSTPNEEAKTLLPKDVSSDEQFYPSDDTISRLEIYEGLGSRYPGIYNDPFLELEMYRRQ